MSKPTPHKKKPVARRRQNTTNRPSAVLRVNSGRGSAAQAPSAPKGRKQQALTSSGVQLIPIPVTREVRPGDPLADILLESLPQTLEPGDILILKHKVVSKAEGRLVDLATIQPSEESSAWAKLYSLDARVIELGLRESRAVIRRKNGVLITETRHGFICANSGVDVSNVDGGRHALLLPDDADRSAANLRRQIKKRTGIVVPVIITDSFGRPWRQGLTEFAIGIAGMKALRDERGRRDSHGYRLRASVEAVADELACAAGLVCGKLNRAPACIVRGFRYELGHGGVKDMLRPAATDLFR